MSANKLLSKEQLEVYDHSADWARSLLNFPRWNIAALTMWTSPEGFDSEVAALSMRRPRYVGETEVRCGRAALICYDEPIVDTVRDIIVTGSALTDGWRGIGIVHSLNHSGIWWGRLQKQHGIVYQYDDDLSVGAREHAVIEVPEAPGGRIEIEEYHPRWNLRHFTYQPHRLDGLDIPPEPEYKKNRYMRLAKNVHWLDIDVEEECPPHLLGVEDFVLSQDTRTDETTATKAFKALAKYLGQDAGDKNYAWLYDALYVNKFIYRGSLKRIYLDAQAVHDIVIQLARGTIKVPGLSPYGLARVQAVFDNRLREPTDTELFPPIPSFID